MNYEFRDRQSRLYIATRLYAEARKRGMRPLVVSYEDLRIDFQAPAAMTLRDRGLVSLGKDANGHFGIQLAQRCTGWTMEEYQSEAKK